MLDEAGAREIAIQRLAQMGDVVIYETVEGEHWFVFGWMPQAAMDSEEILLGPGPLAVHKHTGRVVDLSSGDDCKGHLAELEAVERWEADTLALAAARGELDIPDEITRALAKTFSDPEALDWATRLVVGYLRLYRDEHGKEPTPMRCRRLGWAAIGLGRDLMVSALRETLVARSKGLPDPWAGCDD